MQNLSTVGLPFGKVTKWLTTHVDANSGHIFCQLSEPSISVRYERLFAAINGWGKMGRLAKLPYNPEIGSLCLAHKEKKWFRSQVTHTNSEEKEAEVFFLDFGNSEQVGFHDLYEIPNQFVEILPHAYECIIAEVEPILNSEKWSERAIELIKELTVEQELPGIPVRLSRNILVLRLYADKDAQITVANQLISAGFGQEKGTNSHCNSSTSSAAVVNHVNGRSDSVSSGDSIPSVSSKRSGSSTASNAYKKFAIQKGPCRRVNFK